MRELLYGGEPIAAVAVWSRSYGDAVEADAALEAIEESRDDLEHWSVAALAMGADWLSPLLDDLVARFAEEGRDLVERAAADREAEERERVEATTIPADFDERDGRFLVDLERGGPGEKRVWSIGFDERCERDRFWGWFTCTNIRRAEDLVPLRLPHAVALGSGATNVDVDAPLGLAAGPVDLPVLRVALQAIEPKA